MGPAVGVAAEPFRRPPPAPPPHRGRGAARIYRFGGTPIRALVFVGSSLTGADLRSLDHQIFDVRPPIRRGDIPAAVQEGHRLITIIDGEFFQNFAVTPKEILAAMQAGVVVAGGASMGALRAAELHGYGMHGVGQIYQWYRRGRVTRDDDVGVLYAAESDEYRVFTAPMVNVLWVAGEARQAGWLSPAACRRLVTLARRTHWTERTWDGLIRSVPLSADERRALAAFVADPAHDLKRLDALATIDYTTCLVHASSRRDTQEVCNGAALAAQMDP